MSREEPKNRSKRPETRVVKIDIAVGETAPQMFVDGLPRKKQKGTGSRSIEPLVVRNQNQARKEGRLSELRPGT